SPAASSNEQRVLTVTELTQQIKRALEGRFSRVTVLGEIANWRPGPSGHVYFTLKDSKALVSCVLWRDVARQVLAKGCSAPNLGVGSQVQLTGRVPDYEPRGAYEVVVESIRPAGVGQLYQQFIELKQELEAEGFFSPERKRPLTTLHHLIGVVTS